MNSTTKLKIEIYSTKMKMMIKVIHNHFCESGYLSYASDQFLCSAKAGEELDFEEEMA